MVKIVIIAQVVGREYISWMAGHICEPTSVEYIRLVLHIRALLGTSVMLRVLQPRE